MLEDMGCAKLKKSKDQQQAQELKWFRKVLTENDGMITAHVASYFHIRQQEIERGGTGFWLQRLRHSKQRQKEGRERKRKNVKSCGWEIKGSRRRKRVAEQQTKWICRLQEQKTKGKRNSCQSVKVRVREKKKADEGVKRQQTPQTTTGCLIIKQQCGNASEYHLCTCTYLSSGL